ncbi:MAG: pantoate--beta-alanine ligase [Zetaproteobacteria bacterium]|nr:pantoate--beta-alanine ligase [Zetaproteobacteria bacterium]
MPEDSFDWQHSFAKIQKIGDFVEVKVRMKILNSLPTWNAWQAEVQKQHARITLIPTMGALHKGHIQLI